MHFAAPEQRATGHHPRLTKARQMNSELLKPHAPFPGKYQWNDIKSNRSSALQDITQLGIRLKFSLGLNVIRRNARQFDQTSKLAHSIGRVSVASNRLWPFIRERRNDFLFANAHTKARRFPHNGPFPAVARGSFLMNHKRASAPSKGGSLCRTSG